MLCEYRITYNNVGVMLLYQHIKDLRDDLDLTQKEIAEILNVSQTTYSRYESGTLDIPSSSLIALAKFYKTSVDYLLDLTNDKTSYKK